MKKTRKLKCTWTITADPLPKMPNVKEFRKALKKEVTEFTRKVTEMGDRLPRARGKYKCDRACGAHCTVAQYNDALKTAEKLARRCGPLYVPMVTHNLGYHPSAVSKRGFVSVYYGTADTFTCLLNSSPEVGIGTWVGRGDSPRAAIDDAVMTASLVARSALDAIRATGRAEVL